MAHRNSLIFCKPGFSRNFVRAFKSSAHCCSKPQHYDITIAGGGMVGTAMACSIASNKILQNKKVLLLESSPQKETPKKTQNEDYSNRVVSLNPGTRKFFESLGIWNHISEVRYKTVKKMKVWDACSDAFITFNDDLVEDVSYIVENDVIMYAIEQALQNLGNNITIKYETRIKDICFQDCGKPTKLVTENSEDFTCELLIGADGANSKTRATMGGQYLSWSYNQTGIVATLQLSEPTENVVAWQRFLPSGPVALLPLTDQLSSLVWSTSPDEAKALLKLSDESFVDALNDAFWQVYPKNEVVSCVSQALNKFLEAATQTSISVQQLPPSVSKVIPGSRAGFPLGFGHATKYAAPGVVLIGDAAHRVHPLAGQGVNLGFGDVQCLTNLLSKAAYSGVRLGSLTLLSEYESERQKQNFPVMMAIDGLQRLYCTSCAPAVLMRSLGLQVVQSLQPVKKEIMRLASAS